MRQDFRWNRGLGVAPIEKIAPARPAIPASVAALARAKNVPDAVTETGPIRGGALFNIRARIAARTLPRSVPDA